MSSLPIALRRNAYWNGRQNKKSADTPKRGIGTFFILSYIHRSYPKRTTMPPRPVAATFDIRQQKTDYSVALYIAPCQRQHNASFCAFDNCLIFHSQRIASRFVANAACQTNRTGRRARVYLAPVPRLCARTRRFTSVVQPVYKERSAQRTI